MMKSKDRRRFELRRGKNPIKFGRAITSLPPDQLIEVVTNTLTSGVHPRSARVDLIETLAGWISGDMAKQEATVRLLDYSSIIPGRMSAVETFRLSQLCGALGLFSVSLAMERIGRAKARRFADMSLTRMNSVKRLRSHFFDQVPGSFEEDLERFELTMARRITTGGSLANLSGYARVLLGLNAEPWDEGSLSQKEWTEEVSNSKILVVGPGMVDSYGVDASKFDLVVRTLGNAGIDWNHPEDPAVGRAELVYLNAENETHFRSKIANDRLVGSQIRWICIKRGGEYSGLPNLRRVDSGGELFHRGHINLVPLICVDLSQIPGTSIHVIGASFFASESAYRPSLFKGNPVATSAGRFERSTVISSHNPFQNLALVRNLVETKRVTGDAIFEETCALSEVEYGARLDSLYG